MSDNTPTERFDLPAATAVDDDGPKSKTLLYILIGVGALLLVAVIILIATLAGRNSADSGDAIAPTSSASAPSPTPTVTESTVASPSPTPEETAPAEEPAPAPEPTGARFKTFNASATESCSSGGPGADPFIPLVHVSWSTAGADEAWFVMGTSDAADSQYMQIPLNGSQADFQYEQLFNCSQEKTKYTITLVAPDGTHVSKTWTVTNTGDQF